MHYNPYYKPLIVKYNVADTSTSTQLYFYSSQQGLICNASIMFDKIEIDNVEMSISDLDTAEGKYQFSTTGEHVVKYTLKDPTFIGIEMDDVQITNIGATFLQCTAITEVIIPNSVTTIGIYAFYDCTGLTSITIPNGVTSIGSDAFCGCSGLTNVTIPNGVTSIGSDAFNGCSGLTSITIPNGVTSINTYAFSGCTGLTSITIPNGVTSIGNNAFYQCSGLTNITIPNSVTSIGQQAFDGCTGLTSITIPNNVTSIGNYAFRSCTSLISVTVQATTPPTLGSNAFDTNASGRKIYVPSESVEAYKEATNWSTYASDIEAIQ